MNKGDEQLQQYPRIPDSKVKHTSDFNPRTYYSIQDRVNSDSSFEKKYFLKLIEEGWYKLHDNNLILDEINKGRHFKYRLNGNGLSSATKGTFRSGGIIIGKNDEDERYIMYKAYNGCIFPLQIKDVYEIYVKDSNSTSTNSKTIKKTVKFNRPENPTSYPVYLKHPKTQEDVIVYYAKDNYARDRFMLTKKFEYAYKTGDWTILS